MHSNNLSDNNSASKLFGRGASIYYIGSMVFIAGIALIILGTGLILYFQLSYGSEIGEKLYTIISVATGIILLLIGINLMMKQTKKGYFIVGFSIIMSSLAIFLFIRYFPNNWYYPLVGYIFGFYVIGFLLLLGNTFAGVILWIIGSKSDFTVKEKEEKPRLYTDEEIRRDIEEATKKSIETAVAELQFEIDDSASDILIGRNVSKVPGKITRIKDDIGEVICLKQTFSSGEVEKWGSVGIDKVSMQLANTLAQEKKKSSIFGRFKAGSDDKKSSKDPKKTKKKKEIERKRQKEIEARRKKMEAIKKERELRAKKLEDERNKRIELKKAKREAVIKERELRAKKLEDERNKRVELEKTKRESEIKERELRAKKLEDERNKRIELKKAKREAVIKEREARKRAIEQAKNKQLEAKKALRDAKQKGKKL